MDKKYIDMKNQTNSTELHTEITIAIDTLTRLSKTASGRHLLLLTDQTTVGLQDDDHARFTWVITENVTAYSDDYDQEMELNTTLLKDFRTHIDKLLDRHGWTKLDAHDSPAIFYTTSCGDTLVLTMTDQRLIINLIYSGMY